VPAPVRAAEPQVQVTVREPAVAEPEPGPELGRRAPARTRLSPRAALGNR